MDFIPHLPSFSYHSRFGIALILLLADLGKLVCFPLIQPFFYGKWGMCCFSTIFPPGKVGEFFHIGQGEKMPICRKNDFSKERVQNLFHLPKRDVQRGKSIGFGDYPQNPEWKIITFPQGNPHVVEKPVRGWGIRGIFSKKFNTSKNFYGGKKGCNKIIDIDQKGFRPPFLKGGEVWASSPSICVSF